MNITINNHGTVNIYNSNPTESARDTLLTKLYYARNKPTMGGYEAWQKLLEMYYCAEWDEMINFISSCKGAGGRTRNECIKAIKTIKEAYHD